MAKAKVKVQSSARPMLMKVKTTSGFKTKKPPRAKPGFDKGYEAGWKAGLEKGFHDGFDSMYATKDH